MLHKIIIEYCHVFLIFREFCISEYSFQTTSKYVTSLLLYIKQKKLSYIYSYEIQLNISI